MEIQKISQPKHTPKLNLLAQVNADFQGWELREQEFIGTSGRRVAGSIAKESDAQRLQAAWNEHDALKASNAELVAALSWAIQFAERFAKDHNDGPTMASCIAQARAALSRAKGETK